MMFRFISIVLFWGACIVLGTSAWSMVKFLNAPPESKELFMAQVQVFGSFFAFSAALFGAACYMKDDD